MTIGMKRTHYFTAMVFIIGALILFRDYFAWVLGLLLVPFLIAFYKRAIDGGSEVNVIRAIVFLILMYVLLGLYQWILYPGVDMRGFMEYYLTSKFIFDIQYNLLFIPIGVILLLTISVISFSPPFDSTEMSRLSLEDASSSIKKLQRKQASMIVTYILLGGFIYGLSGMACASSCDGILSEGTLFIFFLNGSIATYSLVKIFDTNLKIKYLKKSDQRNASSQS